jgi:hypothetical protein
MKTRNRVNLLVAACAIALLAAPARGFAGTCQLDLQADPLAAAQAAIAPSPARSTKSLPYSEASP